MLRPRFIEQISADLEIFPVVALLGPRQSGKTTLAREFATRSGKSGRSHYFDLERAADLARLENPELALSGLTGLVVIDEIQLRPGLFSTLRVLVDRPESAARFLVLGSASRDLLRQSSQTLAGRIGFIEVTPFQISEVGNESIGKLWLRGGFPRSFLAGSEEASARWRQDFIRTFLERDLPALGIEMEPARLRRFWLMLTHYHGQIFNAAEVAGSMMMGHATVKKYIDVLAGSLMMRVLTPWHENLGKRQIKASKLYFRDSGIYHRLLDLNTARALDTSPKLGASWEGFALEETIQSLNVTEEQVYFWAVHSQAELDLLVVKGDRKLGFEFKYSDAPRFTRSMAIARESLGLESLTVIYPGDVSYDLNEWARVVAIQELATTS